MNRLAELDAKITALNARIDLLEKLLKMKGKRG